MRRNSLFLTLFLSFLVSVLLMGLLTMGLTLVMAHQGILRTGREDLLAEAVRVRGMALIEVFEAEGYRGVGRSIQKDPVQDGFFIHLFDGDGNPITQDPLSARLADSIVDRLARGETFFRIGPVVLSARRVTTERGSYILAGAVPVPPPWHFLGRNPVEFWLRLAGLIATAGVVCFILARHIIGPVLALNKAALAVTEGDLAVRVGETILRRGDEIGELGRSFDRMTRHVAELLEAQERLLRDVSHELRSPLARLNVALALARKKADGSLGGPLDRIEREAENLNAMIGRLLSLSRLEADLGPLRTEREDMTALVMAITDDAHFEASHHGKGVRFIGEDVPLWLECNGELVKSAVENVVRNALRYTAEGTDVDVELFAPLRGHDGVVIRVADRGPGVPDEELENLFRPFYRLEGARDRQSGGVGLGLTIARRAVDLHGGTIRALNRDGGGLTVELFLPRPEGERAGVSGRTV